MEELQGMGIEVLGGPGHREMEIDDLESEDPPSMEVDPKVGEALRRGEGDGEGRGRRGGGGEMVEMRGDG